MAVTLALLVSLVWLYLVLDGMGLQGSKRLTLGVPASLYLAWISVASVANITAWLVNRGLLDGLAGLSGPLWAALLAMVAALIGAATLVLKRDLAFGLVLAWALYGIYLARPQQTTVVTGVLLAGELLLLGLLLGLTRRGRRPLLTA